MENKENIHDATELLKKIQVEGGKEEQFEDIIDGDCGLDEEEDFEFTAKGENQEDNQFDEIVGTLQEVLLDEKFEILTKKFCMENCMHFEATEENKLIYMDLFKKYQEIVEQYILQKL